jgi:predicted nuclease of restriction endonuclease-like RecB superfamily
MQGDRVVPTYLRARTAANARALAETLLDAFTSQQGARLGDLETILDELREHCTQTKQFDGFEKLLMDACTFQAPN